MNILPKLSSSLANYGIEKLGASLGLDPRISSLIGTPISAGINAGLTDGANTGQDIIDAINLGIRSGVVTLGVEYATNKLDPTIGALLARAVTGAISGGLSKDHDIFKGIYEAYLESAGHLFTLDGYGSDAYSQTVYLSKVIDFSNLIRDKGFAQAFETYATSIFYRDSVEALIRAGGTIANYFQTALTNPQALPENMRPSATTYKGQTAILMPTGSGDYLIISADGKQVLAQSKGGYYYEGKFGIDDQGNWVLMNGSSSQYADTGLITLTVDAGALKKAEFHDYQGEAAYNIYGEGSSSIKFDSNGDLRSGVIENEVTGSKTVIQDGKYVKSQNAININDLLKQDQPWYEKYNATKLADFTDSKIDDIATAILGDAQDNVGWILSATAINSARDIIKSVFVDALRLGSSLPGAADDFSDAWQDAKNGSPLSAGFQALLGTGKILQEFSRAAVFLGVFKGLGTSAAKAESATLKEALATAKATGKQTTVIGHFEDTLVAKDWPNHNVLHLPKEEFQRLGGWEYNKQWLQEAIDRGDDIYLASELKWENSSFKKELDYLSEQGFERVGNYMRRKK